MILTDRTLSILKGCGQINPRILLRKGSVIQTKNGKEILIADIDEHIPMHCYIENLPDFLKKVKQMKNPNLDFHSDHILMNKGLAKAKFFSTPDLTSTDNHSLISCDSYFLEIKGRIVKEAIEKEFANDFKKKGSQLFYKFHVDMKKPIINFYLYRERIKEMFDFCSNYEGGHWGFLSCSESNSIYFKFGYTSEYYEYLNFHTELFSLKVGNNTDRDFVSFIKRKTLTIPLSFSFVPYWDVHIYPSTMYFYNDELEECEVEGPYVLSLNSGENNIKYFIAISDGPFSFN
jgi:hypothetical protein